MTLITYRSSVECSNKAPTTPFSKWRGHVVIQMLTGTSVAATGLGLLLGGVSAVAGPILLALGVVLILCNAAYGVHSYARESRLKTDDAAKLLVEESPTEEIWCSLNPYSAWTDQMKGWYMLQAHADSDGGSGDQQY